MSSLEQQAADRRERLAALRNLKRKHADDSVASESEEHLDKVEEPEKVKVFKPRNFDPVNRAPKMGFDAPPTQISDNETIEVVADAIQQQSLEELAKKTSTENGLDLKNLQPKRANWDLKRDLEPKLQILQQRTDNAISKAVRERILNARNLRNAASGGASS